MTTKKQQHGYNFDWIKETQTTFFYYKICGVKYNLIIKIINQKNQTWQTIYHLIIKPMYNTNLIKKKTRVHPRALYPVIFIH